MDSMKQGLCNSVMEEFDHLKKVREEFIASKAQAKHTATLTSMMRNTFELYLELSEE